jgi:hypothetical protein
LAPKCSKYKPEARNRRSQKPKARSKKKNEKKGKKKYPSNPKTCLELKTGFLLERFKRNT